MLNGKELSLETGRFAKLADAAVMVRYGDTMVLVTVVANTEPKDLDFLPLTCDYREKAASAGKIPGGFFRREARPTTKEVLASRLIDRPIRPLMPKDWRHETQIIATVYSYDRENESDVLATLGASAALTISNIPFNGPITVVRVGRVNGTLIINPTLSEIKESDIDMLVAGSDTSIVMVEGASKEISEEDFVVAMEFGHEGIKVLNGLQLELAALCGKPKREIVKAEIPAEIKSTIDTAVTPLIQEQIRKESAKEARSAFRKHIRVVAMEAIAPLIASNELFAAMKFDKIVDGLVKKIEAREMREMILTEGRRLDGRKTDEIRNIAVETNVLPRAHGSALFTRGETQSLTTVTLGTKRDQQLIDGLMPTYEIRYMLHYNFPPFSTGEAGRFGFTSRREIGHGDLAERSLENFIPNDDDFPYTIRVVSDILESNGSSSMATVCAGSLALFQAGVPMKKAVAGIAMGLILEDGRVAVLSDILGDEDFLGDMDFKVTGTAEGITACQMDIKVEGLSVDIMRKALAQAHTGRMHILGIMNEAMSKPNEEISPFAPKLTTIYVPVEMIGLVIGPGGETIRSIVKETGAEINIDDDGKVTIAAVNSENAQAAVDRIKALTRPVELGMVYQGTVKEIREGLGAFVEFLPKKQGLLHVSQLDYKRVENVSDVLKVGEVLDVKVIEVQPDGKVRLSRRATMPPPEGWTEEPPRSRPPSGGGYDRGGPRRDGGGRDDRGPRRDDRGGGRDDRGPRRDDRPRDDRPHDDRPRDDRPRDDRPRDDRPRDDRPRDDGDRPRNEGGGDQGSNG